MPRTAPEPTTMTPDTRAAARLARIAALADADDFRTYAYTEGWDEDDAELGWVDHEVVQAPRRMH